jgi:hypothetical protein
MLLVHFDRENGVTSDESTAVRRHPDDNEARQ